MQEGEEGLGSAGVHVRGGDCGGVTDGLGGVGVGRGRGVVRAIDLWWCYLVGRHGWDVVKGKAGLRVGGNLGRAYC